MIVLKIKQKIPQNVIAKGRFFVRVVNVTKGDMVINVNAMETSRATFRLANTITKQTKYAVVLGLVCAGSANVTFER